MRTVEEIQKEIDEVSAAIRGIIGGAQSYTIGSRSVTKANLSELRAWRTDLAVSDMRDGMGDERTNIPRSLYRLAVA